MNLCMKLYILMQHSRFENKDLIHVRSLSHVRGLVGCISHKKHIFRRSSLAYTFMYINISRNDKNDNEEIVTEDMCHSLGPTIAVNSFKFLCDLFVEPDSLLHEHLVDATELFELHVLEVVLLGIDSNFIHHK